MTPPDLETPASGARERFYSAGCRAVSNRRLARRADDLTLRGLSSGLGAAAIAARKPSRKNCARPLRVSLKVSENVAPLGRQRTVRSPEKRRLCWRPKRRRTDFLMPSRLDALRAALAKLEASAEPNRASEGPDGGQGRQGRSAIRQTAASRRLGTP